MLDIKWIRDNPDAFVKGLTDRGFNDPKGTLNRILSLDEERRATIQKLQEAQGRRNAASKEIGQAMAAKDAKRAAALKDEVARLKTEIQEGETAEREVEKKYQDVLANIPNAPAPDVPVGPDAEANVELRKVGTPRKFSFQPKQHFELGEALGLMDFETAAKLSGARFVVLKGALARLERVRAVPRPRLADPRREQVRRAGRHPGGRGPRRLRRADGRACRLHRPRAGSA